MLPRILSRALVVDGAAHLTVVGDGPDFESLRARFVSAGMSGHFEMKGRVAAGEVAAILRGCGVFVLPSRFEGCSNSTLEAMASGCVPLLSRLPGITDHLVENGRSGYLFAPGDWRGMGNEWGRLIRSEAIWREMGVAARDRVRAHFSLDQMANGYARLFESVVAEPDLRPAPKGLAQFSIHPGMGPTWRRWIPDGAKKWLRTWAARMGVSP